MRNTLRQPRRRPYMGALPYTDSIQQQIIDAANAGAVPGTITANLLGLGYTMAEISHLYNTASSTATLTPQIIQYLQQENGYLQQKLSDQNKTWIWAGVIAFGIYLWTTPARNR